MGDDVFRRMQMLPFFRENYVYYDVRKRNSLELYVILCIEDLKG